MTRTQKVTEEDYFIPFLFSLNYTKNEWVCLFEPCQIIVPFIVEIIIFAYYFNIKL